MSIFENLNQFLLRLASYGWWEVALEVAIIWVVVYIVWRFLQGTRGAGAIRGLLLIVLCTIALRLIVPADMLRRVAYLYDNMLGFAALALVIIFQPELRRGVIRLGETSFFRSEASDASRVTDAVVAACAFLSRSKFGALIAFERQIGLRETVEGGKPLDAQVSAELLESIFWPNSPLHDMGVVIRSGRIAAAGVQFPLAEPDEIADSHIGTRHRAAIGLTEETDAVVVIVSEETGAISSAFRGNLVRGVSLEELRAFLTSVFVPGPQRAAATPSAPVDGASVPASRGVPPPTAGGAVAKPAVRPP
jgi:diadenylate cyclase